MNNIEYAVSLAKTVKGQFKVAALVLDKRGYILSYGVNSYTKTHPNQADCARRVGLENKQFLHAEIAALVRCKRQGHKMIVVRVGKSGNILPIDICPICQYAIKQHGIKFVETSV